VLKLQVRAQDHRQFFAFADDAQVAEFAHRYAEIQQEFAGPGQLCASSDKPTQTRYSLIAVKTFMSVKNPAEAG
jgi:hypothetical protein